MKVTKTIKSGKPGTIKLAKQYGNQLLNVRYYDNPGTKEKFITVELKIKSKFVSYKPNDIVTLKFESKAQYESLNTRLNLFGGKYKSDTFCWEVPFSTVEQFHLEKYIIPPYNIPTNGKYSDIPSPWLTNIPTNSNISEQEEN